MSREDGLKGVIAGGARAGSADASAAEEQLDLLALPSSAPVRLMDEAKQIEVANRERAGGRPKGARNLMTREIKELALRAGTHPLLNLMRWGSLSPEEMASRLGIKTSEAFDRLVAIWRETTPYFVGKAALTDEEGRAVPMISLNIGGQTMASGPDARPPWEALNDPTIIEQYQQLEQAEDEPEAAMSHGSVSHG